MDKDVARTHTLSDFSFNLSHSILVPHGLSDDTLCFVLTDNVLVDFLYKLRGSPCGFHIYLKLIDDILRFLLIQLWKAEEVSKTNIEVASEVHRGVRVVFCPVTGTAHTILWLEDRVSLCEVGYFLLLCLLYACLYGDFWSC